MSFEEINRRWQVARQRAIRAAWWWVARQIQPYLEPTTTTMISNVQVWNDSEAPAFQFEPDGVKLAPGIKLTGAG